jgi:hypothetical protein
MGAGDHPAQVGIANAYRIVRLLSAQLTWSANKENRDGEGRQARERFCSRHHVALLNPLNATSG